MTSFTTVRKHIQIHINQYSHMYTYIQLREYMNRCIYVNIQWTIRQHAYQYIYIMIVGAQMVRFTMCWCFIFSGHGGWSYKSILVGRIDIRPERVVVVSGLSKIFFSLVLNRHSFLISKQLLIYSQNVLPTSRSPFRQDMSVLKFSFVGSCGISVKLFS